MQDCIKNNIDAQIELKKTKNLQDNGPKCKAQAVVELITSSFLSNKPSFQLLMDLNKKNYAYWYACKRRSILCMEVSLKEAFFLLKYVTNDVPDELKDSFPEDFLVRGRWKGSPTRLSTVVEGDADQDGHNGSSSAGGGGSGPRGSSSSSCGSTSTGNETHEASSASTFSPSTSLSLQLASLYSYAVSDASRRDLDLMDMLDSADQRAALREFVAKCVVPTMI